MQSNPQSLNDIQQENQLFFRLVATKTVDCVLLAVRLNIKIELTDFGLHKQPSHLFFQSDINYPIASIDTIFH